LGANLRALTAEEKRRFNISSGVLVTDISNGLIAQQTNMRKGFVITTVNDRAVSSSEDVQLAISQSKAAQLGGFYPGNNGRYYYALRLNGAQGEQ
jgi:S1-C subfamily serine protease